MQGLILIDKPEGMSSHAVVSKIRRLTGEKRVGHTGTLDPMATGVLPVLVGRATRLSDYLLNSSKSYSATFRLGVTTDTEDITGKILTESDVSVTELQLKETLNSFLGRISQLPPMYSAIKKNGVKLYEMARKGIELEREAREIEIESIVLTSYTENVEFSVDVTCSKGTYIRSLGRDIGEKLGCGATMTALRRTSNAGFDISRCIDLNSLDESNISDFIIPAEDAVFALQSLKVSEKQAARFSNGGALKIYFTKLENYQDGESIKIKLGDQFIGIGKVCDDVIKPCVLIDPYELPLDKKRTAAVALGTFDGLHKGHLSVLKNATESGLMPIAVAFAYPPSNRHNAIMSKEEKEKALKSLGFEKIHFLDFEKVRDMSGDEFLSMLCSRFNVGKICCGFNYTYGKDKSGNAQTLAEFCSDKGIELSVAEPIEEDGHLICSTVIREYISNGLIERANSLIFNKFGFSGEIVHGDHRGRTIGFPTINQQYPEQLILLKFGVYEARVEIEGETYKGIANIGIRPTFRTENVMCETYVIGLEKEVYGSVADVRLIRFLREEREFESIEHLKKQITNDLESITKPLSE